MGREAGFLELTLLGFTGHPHGFPCPPVHGEGGKAVRASVAGQGIEKLVGRRIVPEPDHTQKRGGGGEEDKRVRIEGG